MKVQGASQEEIDAVHFSRTQLWKQLHKKELIFSVWIEIPGIKTETRELQKEVGQKTIHSLMGFA